MLNIDTNITIYDDMYLKDIKKEDKCIYLLYTNLDSNAVSQDIIYNIMDYKDIYDEILNNYRDDLFSSLWHKYKVDNNIIIYIVKEVLMNKSQTLKDEVCNLFTDIIVEAYNKNIKNLYTYYNFDTYLNKSLFELYLSKLSAENINVHICANRQ